MDKQIVFYLLSLALAEISCNSKFISRIDYENNCGDLAISCIANCPAFRHRCFASHVADSIFKAPAVSDIDTPVSPEANQTNPPPTLPIAPPQNVPINLPPTVPINRPPFAILLPGRPTASDYDCKSQAQKKNYCILGNEYNRSEDCCQGSACVPFRHSNGQSAAIGYCFRVDSLATFPHANE